MSKLKETTYFRLNKPMKEFLERVEDGWTIKKITYDGTWNLKLEVEKKEVEDG